MFCAIIGMPVQPMISSGMKISKGSQKSISFVIILYVPSTSFPFQRS